MHNNNYSPDSISSPLPHFLWIESSVWIFDLLLTPIALLSNNLIMETFELLRALALYNLLLHSSLILGLTLANITHNQKVQKVLERNLNFISLFSAAAIFSLWSFSSNIFVIKTIQGIYLGYFKQSVYLHESELRKYMSSSLGALLSITIIILTNSVFASALLLSTILIMLIFLLGLPNAINTKQSIIVTSACRANTRETEESFKTSNKDKSTLKLRNEPSNATVKDIPMRYHIGCGSDAAARWRHTLEWRSANGIDEILCEEQPFFKMIKQSYPQYFHGRSKSGCPIMIEQVGRIDVRRLKANGIDKAILLRHYLFILEYLWNVIEPKMDGKMITILDVKGVSVYDLMGDALDFLRIASKTVQEHYVERCHHMFIVNAPTFFHIMWRVISTLLHANTRKKIKILSFDLSELQLYIDASVLPIEYGGNDTTPLGECKFERDLREFVDNIKMKTSVRIIHEDLTDFHDIPLEEDNQPDVSDDGNESTVSAWIPNSLGDVYSTVIQSLSLYSSTNSPSSNSPNIKNVIPRPAFLGSDNAYIFDSTQKTWMLNPATSIDSSVDQNEMDIIKAIEAAHDKHRHPIGEVKDAKKRGLITLCVFYICWRIQISACLLCLPITLYLPFYKGGFGYDLRSVCGIFLASSFLWLIVLVPLYFSMESERIILHTLKTLSQFQVIALVTISSLCTFGREIQSRSTNLVLVLSIFILLCSWTTIAINTQRVSLLIDIQTQRMFRYYSIVAEGLGSTAVLYSISLLFGDQGVSKFNIYFALLFLLEAVVTFSLAYTVSFCGNQEYFTANFTFSTV